MILSFAQSKGGVGKSAMTSIVAHFLGKKDKVLVLDMDAQSNVAFYLATDKDIALSNLKTGNIEVNENVQKNIDLVAFGDNNINLSYNKNTFDALRNYLIKLEYKYILIDNPPSFEGSLYGVSVSDYTVIVAKTDNLSLNAIDKQMENIEMLKEINPNLKLLGIALNMYDARSKLDNEVVKQIREKYGKLVFESIVKQKVAIKEMSVKGVSSKYARERRALKEYKLLTQEILERIEK